MKFLNDYALKVTNRFKGLDLIDRVPKELWTEVRGIVQEALQIAVNRREAKGKGGKKR